MGMIACPECGTSISDRARVCMNCGYCGTEVDRPISEQNEGNLFPHINVEFERWDLSRDESTFVEVPMAPKDSSLISERFGNWKFIQTAFPAFAEAVIKMAEKEDIQWVAKIPEYYKRGLKNKTFHFALDKDGELLPCIHKAGERGNRKYARLEEQMLPKDVLSSIQHLETQAALAMVMVELGEIEDSIRNLQTDLQNDRLALAEASMDKLQQALAIRDGRRRETYILAAISSATEAKQTLMLNFMTRRLQIEAKAGHSMIQLMLNAARYKGDDTSASDALRDLAAITNMVRVEGLGYLALGEGAAVRESLREFSEFVDRNNLADKDTLRRIGCSLESDDPLQKVIGQFNSVNERMSEIQRLGLGEECDMPHVFLEPFRDSEDARLEGN